MGPYTIAHASTAPPRIQTWISHRIRVVVFPDGERAEFFRADQAPMEVLLAFEFFPTTGSSTSHQGSCRGMS
jgi:hypothetical protein